MTPVLGHAVTLGAPALAFLGIHINLKKIQPLKLIGKAVGAFVPGGSTIVAGADAALHAGKSVLKKGGTPGQAANAALNAGKQGAAVAEATASLTSPLGMLLIGGAAVFLLTRRR